LVLVVIPVDAMVSKAVRETHAKLTKHIIRLVGRRMSQASIAKVEILLDLVEHFAIDNPTINFHLHMSGYDLGGKVLWVPIFEDQVVLDSPAKRVLSMVHRYIESTESMLSGSTTLLEGMTWRAAAKNRSCKKLVPRALSPTASNLKFSAIPLATGAPSTGGAPPPSTWSDVDGADGGNMDSEEAHTDDDAGTDNSATDADDDILSKAAPTGGRNRSSAKTCPETATPRLPVIPSQSSKQVVMAFLTASTKSLTLMRILVPSMAKSVCNGASVAKIRFSPPWWPKTDKGKLWPQTVEVDHVLLRAADKTKGPTDGKTMVSLRRMLATRSAPALERVADMLLMVEREPMAKATLIKFNLRLQLTQLRRTVPIAPMTGITIAGDEPSGQGQSSAPTPAAVPSSQAARPSIAAAAAAGGIAQGSAPRTGFGLYAASLPQGARTTASSFDQTHVREALAAAVEALQECTATTTAGPSTGVESTRAASEAAASTAAAITGAESTGAASTVAARTVAASTRKEITGAANTRAPNTAAARTMAARKVAAVPVAAKKVPERAAAAPSAAASTVAAKMAAAPTSSARTAAASNGAASTAATSTRAPSTRATSTVSERKVAVTRAGATTAAASKATAYTAAAKAAPAKAAATKQTAARMAAAGVTAAKMAVAVVAAAPWDGTSLATTVGAAAPTAAVAPAAAAASAKQVSLAAQSPTHRLPRQIPPALTPRPPPSLLPTPVVPKFAWAQLPPTAKDTE